MCGRFYVDDEMLNEINKICNRIDGKFKRGEVFPSDQAYVIKGSTDKKEIYAEVCKWGYETNAKSRVLFNARIETISEKPLFQRDFINHRCIIPVKGFYEWNKDKQKFYFESKQPEGILLLGGIYRKGEENDKFTIITTQANSSVKDIHDRMPLIIKREYVFNWIYDNENASRILEKNDISLGRKNTEEYIQEKMF